MIYKVRNVVDNDVVKISFYDKLVTKVNAVETSGFVLRTLYNNDKKKKWWCWQKSPDTCGIVKKTDFNAKKTEIEGKIPSVTGLSTTAALNTDEKKIPKISNLVKNTDYYAKILNIKSKYLTTSDYNKFANKTLKTKINEKELVNKSDISGFINKSD